MIMENFCLLESPYAGVSAVYETFFFLLQSDLASDRLINFTHVLCVDLRFVFGYAKGVSLGSCTFIDFCRTNYIVTVVLRCFLA